MQFKDIKSLAPIGVPIYARINHLKKTIEALQKNTLAKESELFIFSDAPRKGDGKKVAEVRKYIHTIDGFKKVHITERKKNNIVFNGRDGIKQLLNQYGKMIFMEEDNVTHPLFLEYMNKALDFFKDDRRIIAINAYNYPIKIKTFCENDFFLSTYFSAYGFATWGDRGFIEALEKKDQYLEMEKDKKLKKKIRKTHPHLLNACKLMHEGKLEAGDYKINFFMRKNDFYCVKPIKSFVNNIGHDGSGVHCGKTNRFEVNLNNVKKVHFKKGVSYNSEIDKEIYKYIVGGNNVLERSLSKIKRFLKKHL